MSQYAPISPTLSGQLLIIKHLCLSHKHQHLLFFNNIVILQWLFEHPILIVAFNNIVSVSLVGFRTVAITASRILCI